MAEILDAAILLWLIGTWFYEGHHRRCRVEVICPNCGQESTSKCCKAPESEEDDEAAEAMRYFKRR